MLSRLVIAFLPSSKCLLFYFFYLFIFKVSFNFMAAVTICSDLETKKIKSLTVSIVSPSISHQVMGPDAMILVF